MSAIKAQVEELAGLELEIKSLRKRIAILRKRHRELTKSIADFIEEKEAPGLKHAGLAVKIREKGEREYKKKSDKHSDGVAVLESYGISNANEALEELMEAMRGAPRTKKTISITAYKGK